ncbi:MAG: hypothetical protein BGO49_29705 [Planctomycetales bacterium 71-10]|nr:MAG: hypothetical protein BGO49_29705 [Planctomycetales bacterium 71-10]
MGVGKVLGARLPARAAWFAAVVAGSAVFLGCDGADQTTGTQAEPDAEAVKRQEDMRQFYSKNPLPKARRGS